MKLLRPISRRAALGCMACVMGLVLTTLLIVPAFAAGPQNPGGDQGWNAVRLFLAGPALLLIFVSFLSAAAMIAAAFGLLDRLTAPISRAIDRLEHKRALPVLWGLSFTVLMLAVCAVLINIKPLALLGVLTALAGVIIVGLGVCVAAIRFGRDLAITLGRLGSDDLTALKLGLTLFLGVAVLPFIGWILIILAAAAGIGALLEAWLVRPR